MALRNLQYQPTHLRRLLCRDYAIPIASVQFLYTTGRDSSARAHCNAIQHQTVGD